ncbi:MAG TPA: chromosome segregation protein SMC [Mycobacteriales bacterium]|nr:chromosome segregation protein SMC [Mycobacteriales bacterium]
MHLKALTLKGFKSFASATTLRLEPGVTCVVGPNGSGKSNVVDAISWVLGEQGAKALRGGKMEDVIFAGTAGRPPLGRAEVTLTIDNSDNALPIDYTEVSITRRMFRSGDSEYEINGDSCRLLDIQELLSDSGIGRELHVVVGQGQLDSVLQSRPEDRRGFIEEAAGVLKHRKRKEKALRKLDAMQANLTRLTDLTGELRRQLKPLGRQAEVARRAATIQAELRDARLRLLADDLVVLRSSIDKEVADESAIRGRRSEVEAQLATAQTREAELEQVIAADAPKLAAAQDTWYRLSALTERFGGTLQLAAERERYLAAPPDETSPGRDPDELEAEAEAMRDAEDGVARELNDAREQLAETVGERTEWEKRVTDAERAIVAAARAAADRREGLAKLTGQVDALQSKATAGGEEMARLATAAAEARERAAEAQAEFDTVQSEVGALDEGELSLDEVHEAAVVAHEDAQNTLRELTDAEREAERDRSSWQARREALALGLNRKDGAGALLAAGERLPGLLGSVAALLTVDPGHEAALAAALGGLADAVALSAPADAATAVRLLKAQDAGRASMLIGSHAGPIDRNAWPQLPVGARWALDLVRAPESLRPALGRALDRVAVVADLDEAARLVATLPSVRAVTPEGDLLGADAAVGGSASAPSVIEVQAAVDEAQQKVDEASARCTHLQSALEESRARVQVCATEVERALSRLHESDAKMSAVAEQLAHLGSAARSAAAEAERLEQARYKAEQARAEALRALEEAQARLEAAQEAPLDDEEPSTQVRDDAAESLTEARQAEVEARLAVRTAEERSRALAGRADALEAQARRERETRARQERARIARARGALIAGAVARTGLEIAQRLARSVATAETARDAAAAQRRTRDAELASTRTATRELAGQLERLTDAVHRDEVARAEQRLRVEALETKAVEEHGVGVDELIGEYGPDVPMPPAGVEMLEYETARERGEQVTEPVPGPYDRAMCEKRAAKADREFRLLGKVNPLALEEFAALEERHKFLSEQLEDLKATRRDLLIVVKEVDDRIHDVFESAFTDTAREFEIVFATLFPGGEGKLLLTDPENLLTTGIEVEARPPGKKVKRLSLLSGGERSLVAVALLVAIFRARPSPFYVMDEIEAALDDTNLGRLIGLLSELRATSQLIVITHQKRTMEIADALYGVSMRGDGITTVISQRMHEFASA